MSKTTLHELMTGRIPVRDLYFPDVVAREREFAL